MMMNYVVEIFLIKIISIYNIINMGYSYKENQMCVKVYHTIKLLETFDQRMIHALMLFDRLINEIFLMKTYKNYLNI